MRKRFSGDIETFTEKARAIHGDRYDYSSSRYINNHSKIEIVCRTHGPFWQTPASHIAGRNCRRCENEATSKRESHTIIDFIEKSRTIHGDRYDYSKSTYEHSATPIEIVCRTHGPFWQTPASHYQGCGCQKCAKECGSSKPEHEVAAWIESMGLQVERNDRTALSSGMEIDLFLPSLRIGIEYNGRYWHSDSVEKNWRKHEFKHEGARRDGIRLIAVWDFDWLKRPDTVKRHLLHAFGMDPDPRINARSCETVHVENQDAAAFHDANHIQGACRGTVLNIGLKHGGELAAVMSFTRGGTRRGMIVPGEWELARYSTSAIVRGGASKLFQHFIRHIKPTAVWSFSDRQHFCGTLYRTIGFMADGSLPADYRVAHRSRLTVWHKSLWQRASIPRRLRELGSTETFDPATDPRSERQMQDATGVLRVWDAGKIRWLWKPR